MGKYKGKKEIRDNDNVIEAKNIIIIIKYMNFIVEI
jgi:hypothetical protein